MQEYTQELKLTVEYTPSSIYIVPNYTTRGNNEKFNNIIRKAIDLGKNSIFFNICAEIHERISSRCKITSNDLSVYQVLEHYNLYKKRNKLEVNNPLNNTIIFVIIDPDIIESNAIERQQRLTNRAISNVTNELKSIEIGRIDSQIAENYDVDTPTIFHKVIRDQIMKNFLSYTGNHLDNGYNGVYELHDNYSDEANTIVDNFLLEENRGPRFTRINPFRRNTENRMALKKINSNFLPKFMDRGNFPNRYGGRTCRSKKYKTRRRPV
jgi:hypothetical protein